MSGFRIESLWAYLAVDAATRDEGVVSMGPLPMIGADFTRLHLLRPYAEELAQMQNAPPIVLVQFTTRIDLETL